MHEKPPKNITKTALMPLMFTRFAPIPTTNDVGTSLCLLSNYQTHMPLYCTGFCVAPECSTVEGEARPAAGCLEAIPRVQCDPRQDSETEWLEDHQRDGQTRLASRQTLAQSQSRHCTRTSGRSQGGLFL